MNKLTAFWKNPWNDVVIVPIEELVECAHGLNEVWSSAEGNFLMTKELLLEQWRSAGEKLDAYILPGRNGRNHCIGIRYGAKGNQYLSPHGVQSKIQTLLEKYQPSINDTHA